MFPDFLCIGAVKSATTWLYINLYKHPQIWMPPLPTKELHYFDNPSHKITDKLFGQRWYDLNWRKLVKSQIKHFLCTFDCKRFAWDFNYLFVPRSYRWYASLFPSIEGKITGEITPTYARLGEDLVCHIYKTMPKTRIIYLLRNPILRTWSNALMDLSRWGERELSSISDREFIDFFNKSNKREWGNNYLESLKIWETYYPKEQIFIGFFEEIIKRPEDFLIRVFEFLRIDASHKCIPDDVREKHNPGSGHELPKKYLEYLACKYYDQIEKLHIRFNNEYTQEWLNFAKTNLE